MPTIHGTPAGNCILFSSPGSWDHLEGDRQQSDSSSQEPSPQQQALKKANVKIRPQASDWKWAFFSMSNFEDPTIEAVPISIIFFATAFQFQIQRHEKSQAAAIRKPGWGHPTCHESLQPWGLRDAHIERHRHFLLAQLASPKQLHHWELLQLCSIFHLCAPFAGTGTDVHQ